MIYHNTPKFLRKPDPLGKEIKKLACSRWGTMLYPDIQKGKEATNTAKFQQHIRRTAVCTKRLMMAEKGCGQLTSNYTYFFDSCLSEVKTAEEKMAEGVEYCGPAKTRHNVFFLDTFRKVD